MENKLSESMSVDDIMNMAYNRGHCIRSTFNKEVDWNDYEEFKQLLHEKGEFGRDRELALKLRL